MATLIFLAITFYPHGVGEVLPVPVKEEPPVVVPVIKEVKPRYGQNLPDQGASNLPDIFKKIAWCESKNMQFNSDGTVHRGVQNPQDVGKYQINEGYHLEASRALGIDIYTLEGNTAYALRLYKANGTRDWNWSKWCWADETVSTSTWALRFKQNL